MSYQIIAIIAILFVFSFILAWRAQSELEIPEEAKKKIRAIWQKKVFSGIFLFFRDRIIHYPDATSSSGTGSSAVSSSSSSEEESDLEKP